MTFQPPPAISPVPEDGKPRPFWSVMIPTYNPQWDYLEQTLRSVLAQDPGPEQMQIEVVDDCSPKVDVIALVRKIAGDRVAVFRSRVNKGLAGSWNGCIERATGEWVHILHQDDIVLPGFYARLQAAVAGQPTIGAAFSRHGLIEEQGNVISVAPLLASEAGRLTGLTQELLLRQRIQCAAITVRRSVYERVGLFNQELRYTLDWEMWLRLSMATEVWYQPEVLAWYRLHSGSTTTGLRRSAEDTKDLGRFFRVVDRYCTGSETRRILKESRQLHIRMAVSGAEMLFHQGDVAGARCQITAVQELGPSLDLRLRLLRLRARILLGEVFGGTRPHMVADE